MKLAVALLIACSLTLALTAQTTQGVISGVVQNRATGAGIPSAHIFYCRIAEDGAIESRGSAQADDKGYYTFPSLSPGEYRVRAQSEPNAVPVAEDECFPEPAASPEFQAQEKHDLMLSVAGLMDLNFNLLPKTELLEPRAASYLTPDGMVVRYFGADERKMNSITVDTGPASRQTGGSSISNVVEPGDIQALPLAGNNLYSLLLAEPGTSASNSTTRSLGISANGMRPSSSSFLLDGVEANFYLISGPLLAVAPEAAQEYRFSTNNFSAEYGGAAGYIANAVTRGGGSAWHGQSYFNLENEILNANGFQDNASGFKERRPSKEDRLGYFAGGPLRRNRLFLGVSTDYLRTRDRESPVVLYLPDKQFLSSQAGCPTSIACGLLKNYPVPTGPADPANDYSVAPVTFEQPIALDRWLSIARLDYSSAQGMVHGTLRAAISHVSQPDFIWSPYSDYISGLTQPAMNLATSWTFTPSPGVVNEFSAGWSDEKLSWNRAHPETPTLFVTGGNPDKNGNPILPVLPGSPAAYGLNNQNRAFGMHDDHTVVWHRHILKVGGGLLSRHLNDLLDYGSAGEYLFRSLPFFGLDLPSQFGTSLSRLQPNFVQPKLDRIYRELQYFFFMQDTFRISPRFTLNAGLRYDNFGGPVSIGAARDPAVELGPGENISARVAAARLVPSLGGSAVYPGANGSFGPRFAFSYNLLPSAGTLLRGGFGIFYDRIFDNLWLNARNNSFNVQLFNVVNSNYLTPPATVLPAYATRYQGQYQDSAFPALTAFQKPLPNGYAEDFFLGVQQAAGHSLSFELNGAGSLGRRLVTTDILNYKQADNSTLPSINWISAQGLSDYYSLSVVSRWRGRQGFLQAAWTWSHAIDEQSDPLAGDFFNLLFVNPGGSAPALSVAGFSHPGDSRGDRGNADFDQRHALVVYGSISPVAPVNGSLSRLVNGWTFSTVAAVRSGSPYSIYTADLAPTQISARARTANPASVLPAAPQPVKGGVQLFEPSAFCPDSSCSSPETGRNAFAGPGLVNLDLSVARRFGLKWLGDSGGITVRADFFNALNHANLNSPGNLPGDPSYGVALFGTPPANSGFPALVPLGDSARRIQLVLRLTF